MSGARSRTKGHNFERKLARIFQELWPSAKRNPQYQQRNHNGSDVEGTPFFIEAKRGKVCPSPSKAFEQALRDKELQNDSRPPMVILRADREEPVLFIRTEDLAEVGTPLPAVNIPNKNTRPAKYYADPVNRNTAYTNEDKGWTAYCLKQWVAAVTLGQRPGQVPTLPVRPPLNVISSDE